MQISSTSNDKVVDIRSRKPHMVGSAICLSCNHEWVAVAEVGSIHLECDHCKLMKGVFKNLAVPVERLLWHCNCGNAMFFITETHAYCGLCGLAQEFK